MSDFVLTEETLHVVKRGDRWVVEHEPSGMILGVPHTVCAGTPHEREVEGLYMTRKRDAVEGLRLYLERQQETA